MLLKVTTFPETPLLLAQKVVNGGLLYSRVSLAGRVQELTQGAEYSRKVREWIPSSRNLDWKTPRTQRLSYPAGRTLCLHRPPAQQNLGGGFPVRAYPEGWGLPFDGLETAAYWEKRFYRPQVLGRPEGTPYLKVAHRGSEHFELWAAVQQEKTGYRSGWWPHRPRKEQDPLRGLYDYLHRGGNSPLRGVTRFRGVQSLLTRRTFLQRRLYKLYRRQREHNLVDQALQNLKVYRDCSRRRKRASTAEACFLFFRRRRLRSYLTGLVSHRNYVNRLTRRGFYRWHPNRWSRLEKASLLGGTYFEARTTWGLRLLGARVGNPLEYHLYNPLEGYGRLIKRRREGSRRWKLGQHSLWGPPFLAARAARWDWFNSTPLGALLSLSHQKEYPPQGAPFQNSLQSGVYWSSRVWGRSRWERPTGRKIVGFVRSLKGGLTVEPNSQQWGRAGTSGVGVFLSLVGELELRSLWSFSGSRSNLTKARPRLSKLAFWKKRSVFFFKWVGWLCLVGGWLLFTPFWWLYSKTAQFLCYGAWWVRRGFFRSQSWVHAFGEFFSYFLWQTFVLPGWDYLTHWVKDTSFFKTLGWVWTSWNLVVSSDDDQRKIELTPVEPVEDTAQEYFLDEIEPTEENIPDEEEEIDLHGGVPRFPQRESWSLGVDFAYDDGMDQLAELFLEEIPYWVGFFFQPLIDAGLRLPLWGLLEGCSLFNLVIKLEYQRLWSKTLNAGGGPRRGRWWKIPLLGLKLFCHWGIWLTCVWVVGSTLSYSTLRLEIVLWGWPWREEYYLFWWALIFALVTKVVGPGGVKDFLFTQIGWSNLMGLFWGATEAAAPEPYYPGRPLSLLAPALKETAGITMRRHKTYDDVYAHLRETDLYVGGGINAGVDEIELILAQKYESGDTLNWDEPDEVNYFNVPLHLDHSKEEEFDSLYEVNGLGIVGNEFRSRANREPHYIRNNYYELTYEGTLGRNIPLLYFEEDLTSGNIISGTYIDDASELAQWARDESQLSNDE